MGSEQKSFEDGASAVVTAVSVILAVSFGVWLTWITITAFIGGQALFFPIEFSGFSLVRGFLWLFIADPIITTIAYWIFMLILLPLVGLIAGVSKIQEKRTPKKPQ
ncbi:MAG: hypothetical protein EXQ67_09320 [Thermoleophilia bacterium]|nr:hypothetical protein [Thermoleophilia bacterium]